MAGLVSANHPELVSDQHGQSQAVGHLVLVEIHCYGTYFEVGMLAQVRRGIVKGGGLISGVETYDRGDFGCGGREVALGDAGDDPGIVAAAAPANAARG